MILFIDINEVHLKKMVINIRYIESIGNNNGHAYIITTSGIGYTAEESYEELCGRLSDLAEECPW